LYKDKREGLADRITLSEEDTVFCNEV
jgi:hypothetical protein